MEVARWVMAAVLAALSGLIVTFNLYVSFASLAGRRTPSYLPIFGFVAPYRLPLAVGVVVFVFFGLSELAGFVSRA